MDNWFAATTINLGARVKVLQEEMNWSNGDGLEREINVCNAELQHLYSYADQHSIELSSYFTPFTEIKAGLELVKSKLQRRNMNRSIWQRIFDAVVGIIGSILWIFGIGSRPQLRGNQVRGYLR